jgi:hypothetical protein
VGTDGCLVFAGVGVGTFVGELTVRGEMVDVLEIAGEGGGFIITGSEKGLYNVTNQNFTLHLQSTYKLQS